MATGPPRRVHRRRAPGRPVTGGAPGGTLGILHLVKGGGMAVRTVVAGLPGSYTGPRYFDRQQFPDPHLLDGASPDVLATVVEDEGEYRRTVASRRVVMGHVSSATLLAAGCRALAVQVREPRSRLLSLYRYWQSQSTAHLDTWGRWGTDVVGAAQQPLLGFLESPVTWPATDGALARQALGGLATPYVEQRTWSPAPSDLERFCDHLAVADWSTESGRFVARVWEYLDVPDPPALDRVNVTEVTAAPQVVDAEARRALDRLTAADRDLLDALTDRGLLPRRSAAALDDEFEATASHLGLRLA